MKTTSDQISAAIARTFQRARKLVSMESSLDNLITDLPNLTDEDFLKLRSAIDAEIARRKTALENDGGHEHLWKDGGYIAMDQKIRRCELCGTWEKVDANGNPQV